jgi:predicted metal-dependent hydrolase
LELPTGELIEAEVMRSPRARVTRIQLGPDRPLRVVVPEGASDEYAVEALRAKSGWVRGKLDEIARATSAPDALDLGRPGVVWRQGEPLPILLADTRVARTREAVLEIPIDREAARGALQRWYRREAGSYLRGLVSDEATRLDYEPSGVSIRDQRTRWGSCSRAGTVSLNWRLFIAPEEVARYVVVHELVHLQVPNHSKLFWRTLSAASPGWRAHARWLREHGNELRRYAVLGSSPQDRFQPPLRTPVSHA